MKRTLFSLLCCCWLIPNFLLAADPDKKGPADLIIHHANVLTLDEKSHVFDAIAIKDGRIIGLGNDDTISKLGGPKTRVLDADARTVLPGLYDSHVHPL